MLFGGTLGGLPGASNLSELYVVASTVLIRRLKKDVLSQLPAKTRQQVFVEIASKSLKEIHELQVNLS
jgi:SWI/SNF-related matrix-associated actin-dependent regulator 1 of chromatin subfamily A